MYASFISNYFPSCPIFDINSMWMKTCRENLHEHVHPHCFKFMKVSKVVMYYRKWSGDKWMGPVTILKVIIKFAFSLIYRRLISSTKKLNQRIVTFANYFQE